MTRTRLALVLVGAGLLLGAPLVALLTGGTDAGEIPRTVAPDVPAGSASPAVPDATDGSPRPEASPDGAVVVPGRAEGSWPGRIETEHAASPPVTLRIDALEIAASVVPVGVEPGGEMQVPSDVSTVGWYRYGPVPGRPGSAVLAAHVDSRTQGRGVFFDLRRIPIGALVVVGNADGSSQTYQVAARRQYDKGRLPLEEIFTRDGTPRLTLITCGGTFDRAAGSYRDNVVVYAVPLG